MHKVSRSQFYEYKRVFQLHGLTGLIDKPPIPASHPNELTNETKQKFIELSPNIPLTVSSALPTTWRCRVFRSAQPLVRNLMDQAGYANTL